MSTVMTDKIVDNTNFYKSGGLRGFKSEIRSVRLLLGFRDS